MLFLFSACSRILFDFLPLLQMCVSFMHQVSFRPLEIYLDYYNTEEVKMNIKVSYVKIIHKFHLMHIEIT